MIIFKSSLLSATVAQMKVCYRIRNSFVTNKSRITSPLYVYILTVSVYITYIGNNSITNTPRNIQIDIQVADITYDSDTTFNVKRSSVKVTTRLLYWSHVAFTHRHLQSSASKHIERGETAATVPCADEAVRASDSLATYGDLKMCFDWLIELPRPFETIRCL